MLPDHYATQGEIIEAFRKLWARAHFNVERLEDLHRRRVMAGEVFALPLPQLEAKTLRIVFHGFGQNDKDLFRINVSREEE